METYYSTSEAAEILGITPKTLRTWDKEGTLEPDLKIKGNRQYSKVQLEAKLGKPLSEAIDPILGFDKKTIERFQHLAETRVEWDFTSATGDTVRERFLSLQCKVVDTSNHVHRSSKCHPNAIITSPEICSIIEMSGCAYSPMENKMEDFDNPVVKLGTLNLRWHLYSHVEMINSILIVRKEGAKLIGDPGLDNYVAWPKCMGYIWITNFTY